MARRRPSSSTVYMHDHAANHAPYHAPIRSIGRNTMSGLSSPSLSSPSSAGRPYPPLGEVNGLGGVFLHSPSIRIPDSDFRVPQAWFQDGAGLSSSPFGQTSGDVADHAEHSSSAIVPPVDHQRPNFLNHPGTLAPARRQSYFDSRLLSGVRSAAEKEIKRRTAIESYIRERGPLVVAGALQQEGGSLPGASPIALPGLGEHIRSFSSLTPLHFAPSTSLNTPEGMGFRGSGRR